MKVVSVTFFQRCEDRYVTGGIIASAEGTSLVRGSKGILPRKFFKSGGSKTLFSALVIRYVSEKSTSYKRENSGVFSAYN